MHLFTSDGLRYWCERNEERERQRKFPEGTSPHFCWHGRNIWVNKKEKAKSSILLYQMHRKSPKMTRMWLYSQDDTHPMCFISVWANKCVLVWWARHSFQSLKSSCGIAEMSHSCLETTIRGLKESSPPHACLMSLFPLLSQICTTIRGQDCCSM